MALHGSAVANLSPILFKGNNRALGVNVLIHQDESASMNDLIQFYGNGTFIGSLQDALLSEKIGTDVSSYPNLYAYFGVYSRNPSSQFTISNPNGSLSVNQAFMRGESSGALTISKWTTSNYFSNSSGHIVNVCTDLAGSTTGGRLTTYSPTVGGGSPLSEDVHGSLWSIWTTPNAISTGTPGRFGSILGSDVRKGSTTIVITNSDEQQDSPRDMINNNVDVLGGSRPINGSTGEMITRNYRVVALSSYTLRDATTNVIYDGILFYGQTSSLPYGYVKFDPVGIGYSITRSANDPNPTTSISGLSAEVGSPTVSLVSNLTSIPYNGSVILTWSSNNAESVLSSSGFNFTNVTSLSGSTLIEDIKEDTAYSITVGNSVEAATAIVQISVGAPNTSVPTVTLSSPSESPEGYVYVDLDGSVTLNWTSTNATSVVSSTGTGFNPTTVSGSTTITNVNSDRTYTITVSGPNGTVESNEIKVLVNKPSVSLNYSIDESRESYVRIESGIYANNQYVFVGGNPHREDTFPDSTINGKPYIFVSPNGDDWKIISPSDSNIHLTDVVFDGDKFVCIGSDYIESNTITKIIQLRSNTREVISTTTTPSNVDFDKIAFGSGIYLGIRGNKYYISTNLINWTEYSVPYESGFISPGSNAIKYLNGNFYLLTTARSTEDTGFIYRSSDGVSWTKVYESPIPGTSNNDGIQFVDITFDGSKFWAIGNANTNTIGFNSRQVLTSSDGLTWSAAYNFTSPGSGFRLYKISSSGNEIVVTLRVADNSHLLSTDGGTTWNFISKSSQDLNYGIPVVNNSSKFAVIRNSDDLGIGNTIQIYDSTNATSWSTTINELYYDVPDESFNNPVTYPIESEEDYLSRTFNITSSSNPSRSLLTTPYTYTNSIANSDPGSGYVGFSSSNVGYGVTEIYISDFDFFGIPQSQWYDTWDDNIYLVGTFILGRGRLYILDTTSSRLNQYEVNSITPSSGYYIIGVSTAPGIGTTTISNGSSLEIDFFPSNDENYYARFDNISYFDITNSDQPLDIYRITWTSPNATTVVSSSGTGFENITSLNSSRRIAGITTETYSITVQNDYGERATSTETIYIPPLDSNSPLPTVTLSSDKSSVGIGEAFNLTWSSTNAEYVSSVAGVGFTAGATSGSTLVTASTNDSYSITVESPSGITTSNIVPITINSPTVTLTSDKTTINLGEPVKLTWSSINATSVASSTGTGFSPTETTGEFVVYPSANESYSITVQGPGGTVTSNSINITINPPNVFFVASSNTVVAPGGSVALNWISTNATSVTSFTGTGFNPTQVSGYFIVPNVTEDRTFTITVSGPSGNSTATINVKVNVNTLIGSTSGQVHNTYLLASQTRGAVFTIRNVFTNNAIDNRVAFSRCLAEFIADTV